MRILFILFITICFSGCGIKVSKKEYFDTLVFAKKHSGIYVLDSKRYDEIKLSESSYKREKREYQKQLEKGLKDKEWKENKEQYIALARKLSSYNVEENAKSLFIKNAIDEKFGNNKYFSFTSPKAQEVVITDDILQRLGSDICKKKCVILPLYFYVDSDEKVHIIALEVLYLYTRVNRMYGYVRDENALFANGSWKYIRYNNTFYLDK